MKSRTENPAITLRVIEKITDKYKDYYRDTSLLPQSPLVSQLLDDILMLKKDCMVAAELAQQYIYKTIETSPIETNKSQNFMLTFEISSLKQEKQQLLDRISALTQENLRLSQNQPENTLNIREAPETSENSTIEIEKLQTKISEYESLMVIEELKHENIVSDLESTNKTLLAQNSSMKNALKDYETRLESLERKLKESISGYTKFLVRKTTDNKDTQVSVPLSIAAGPATDIQKSSETMHIDGSQISRLSLTESEIFDVTAMHSYEIVPQNIINIPRRSPTLSVFNVHKSKTPKMQTEHFYIQCRNPKDRRLEISYNSLGIAPLANYKEIRYEALDYLYLENKNKAYKKKLDLNMSCDNMNLFILGKVKRLGLDKQADVNVDNCKNVTLSVCPNIGGGLRYLPQRIETRLGYMDFTGKCSIISEYSSTIESKLKQNTPFVAYNETNLGIDTVEYIQIPNIISKTPLKADKQTLVLTFFPVYSTTVTKPLLKICTSSPLATISLSQPKNTSIYEIKTHKIYNKSSINHDKSTESYKPELERSLTSNISISQESYMPALNKFKIASINTVLATYTEKNFSTPGLIEESKGSNRRRGSVQARKPAIEEYFALV
jgi:hypothetical protein